MHTNIQQELIMKSNRLNQNNNQEERSPKRRKQNGRFFSDGNRDSDEWISHIDSMSRQSIANEIAKLRYLNSPQAGEKEPSITLRLIRVGNSDIMQHFFKKINKLGLYGQYKS